jgi:hypothetical protein
VGVGCGLGRFTSSSGQKANARIYFRKSDGKSAAASVEFTNQ